VNELTDAIQARVARVDALSESFHQVPHAHTTEYRRFVLLLQRRDHVFGLIEMALVRRPRTIEKPVLLRPFLSGLELGVARDSDPVLLQGERSSDTELGGITSSASP
jgi:hypothetical protein